MTDVELVELAVVGEIAAEAVEAVELLTELSESGLLEGYAHEKSLGSSESLEAETVGEAVFVWSDTDTDVTGREDDGYEPNTFTAGYEDGNVVLSFVADKEHVGEFGAVVEDIRESAGTELRVPSIRFEHRIGTLVDATAEGLRDAPALPEDADLDFHLDHTEETTYATVEASSDVPFERFDMLLPGLVEQYDDIAGHFAEFEL